MFRFLVAALTIFLISSALTVPSSARRVTSLRHLRGGGGGTSRKLSDNTVSIHPNVKDTSAQSSQFSAQFLEAHNAVRSHFKQPLLTWDTTLAAQAQSWVQAHKTECKLEPSGNGKYGENSFWTLGSKNWTPEEVVGTWEDEFRDYNQNTKVCFSESVCGYSTQLLWKNTQRLGCGSVVCDNSKGSLFICFYDPKAQN